MFARLRETGFISNEFFRQTVPSLFSGALIALISVILAYGLDNLKETNKVNDTRMDSFIKIHNEISENRLTLGQERKQEKPLICLPLKTSAWDMGKNQTPIKTPWLLDGLKLLYDDIERYNWHVEYMRYKVMEKNLSSQNAPEQIWQPIKNILDELYLKLEEFEKLTDRELVILGNISKQQHEKRFGKWDDNFTISYFIKKD